ncbi:hypothetical protein JI59_08450 [Novosphingobium pentaromativorans US6-1]|nr:hypothetical protein JI59_08450 [Novosphingobium pentaromativorans US6-1]
MVEGWEKLDLEIIAECFSDDAVWHNMPYPPYKGREAIMGMIARFLGDVETLEFIVHHSGELAPGIVVNERTDSFTMKDGRKVDLPVMGIFEVSDGKIRHWRDYFDGVTMTG